MVSSMVMILLQAYFFDRPQSMGYQACTLEATWPGILKALAPVDEAEDLDSEDSDDEDGSGKEKLTRPFIERVPLSAWSATHTHVSDLTVHSIVILHNYYLATCSGFECAPQSRQLG